MLKVISIFLFTVFVGCVSSKSSSKTKFWQSWNDVSIQEKIKKKPILIDIYTDWCVYCKVMDNTVYKNDSVINYIQQHFYSYKLNAEKNDTIVWNNTSFNYNSKYQVHDFAVHLSKGNIAYPTTVVIDIEENSFFETGVLKLKEMEFFLRYFIEAHPLNISKENYSKNFKNRWK